MDPEIGTAAMPSAGTTPQLDRIDSVYFLLFPDWETELRGNRWHFATRWARIKPVVLVNPVLAGGRAVSLPEPRIANSRVLRVQSFGGTRLLAKSHIVLGQVLMDMASHGVERPLLWGYNPYLVSLMARLPAVARVYHASEAYVDMPDLNAAFQHRVEAMAALSDLTIAVSDGVAAGLRRRIEGLEVATITNGCHYAHYAGGKPDHALLAAGRQFRRIAVYAGNINSRLDFDLMERAASRFTDTLFALFGPRRGLSADEDRKWRRLVARANVHAPGEIDADRVRDVYAAADVGLIPYRQDPWLVENGLPLKALEMAATTLPVVSTLMKPMQGIASAIVVTSTGDEFLTNVERMSRTSLSAAQKQELAHVSAANDYDVKFKAVVEAVDRRVVGTGVTTRVDRMIALLGTDWTDAEIRYSLWLTQPAFRRLVEWLVTVGAKLAPAPLKRMLVSDRLRAQARELQGN